MFGALKPGFRSLASLIVGEVLNRKEELRHRAVSLRQHGFLVRELITTRRSRSQNGFLGPAFRVQKNNIGCLDDRKRLVTLCLLYCNQWAGAAGCVGCPATERLSSHPRTSSVFLYFHVVCKYAKRKERMRTINSVALQQETRRAEAAKPYHKFTILSHWPSIRWSRRNNGTKPKKI